MSKVIVADASPLIAFARINQLELLNKLFGTVIIPQAVADECLAEKTRPGAKIIQKAIRDKLIQIHANPASSELANLLDILDLGEAAAIQLASAHQWPLIIDEKFGRAIATRMQLKIIGSAGILLLAKEKKLISEIKSILLQLKEENYYLADHLIHEILTRADE